MLWLDGNAVAGSPVLRGLGESCAAGNNAQRCGNERPAA